jgi:hypothetical protein
MTWRIEIPVVALALKTQGDGLGRLKPPPSRQIRSRLHLRTCMSRFRMIGSSVPN